MFQVFEGWALESIRAGDRELAGRSFNLDRNLDDVTITLAERLPTLSVTAHDMQGRPAEGAWIIVFPEEREAWSDFPETAIRSRITWSRPGRDGSYRFTLVPGKYLVVAVSSVMPEDWQSAQFLRKLAADAVGVDLASGSDIVRRIRTVTVR
jgi:hypothetical protein